MGVCNQCFYIANANTIKVIDINNYSMAENQDTHIYPKGEDIITHKIGDQCKLHGFFEDSFSNQQLYLYCIIETEDNQIDFTRLYFYSRNIAKGDLVFKQSQEVVLRATKLDPVTKFKQIIHESNFQYGIAMRESGSVDMYWNFIKTCSTEGKYFTDVDIDFNFMYLTQEDGTKLRIDTKRGKEFSLETRINLESAEIQSEDKDENRLYRTIANCFKIYPSYSLIKTSFFVAHGNIISLFDIINKQWVNHFFFEEKVINVFRNQKESGSFNVGVYLKNGRIKLIDNKYPTDPESWTMTLNKFGTKGAAYQVVLDNQNYSMLYILTNENGTPNLYGFSRDQLFIMNELVHELKLTTQLINLSTSSTNKGYFVLLNQQEGEMRVYAYYWHQSGDGYDERFVISKVHELKILQELQGKFHSAISKDIDDNLILFDDYNIYKYNIKTQKTQTLIDQNVIGISLIDEHYCYAITNKTIQSQDYTFSIYDINQLFENNPLNKLPSHQLDRVIAGVNGVIDFSLENNRLSYMADYKTIQIVPVLHRNVINFMGMLDRSHYLVTKRVKDKFMALDTKGIITCWNCTTGKLESQNQAKNIDLVSFKIFEENERDLTFKLDWYGPRVLLMSIDPIENIKDESYFDPEILRTSLENSEPYIKLVGKKFHNFKIIEIISESEVKDHFTFLHPYYNGQFQKISFSDNLEYMMERLQNNKVLLYQRKKAMFKQAKWSLASRIQNWPVEMSQASQANYLCSPDLMYYLDCDRTNNQYVIKDTITQKIYASLPKGLIDPKVNKPADFARCFRWIDPTTIRLVNKQGLEKMLALSENGELKELGAVKLPSFFSGQSEGHHYFREASPGVRDTLSRLQRSYQVFKSAYYVDGMREKWSLYDWMFRVDYTVNNGHYKYVIDLSFTYLHWLISDKIREQQGEMRRNTSSDEKNQMIMDQNDMETLAYNIFPGCNTVLHHGFRNSSLIKSLFAQTSFEVPFIVNLQNKSPIDVCLDHKDFKSVDLYLQYLATQQLDHHSRTIVGALPTIIENNYSSVDRYLASRFLQTDQLKEIKRGCLNKDIDGQVLIQSYMWEDINHVKSQVFIDSPIQGDVQLEFLDIPELHCYANSNSDAFFQVLASTESIQLFSNRGIQTIIDFKWPLVYEYTIKKLLIPFICFMLCFFLYSNFAFVLNYNQSEAELEITSASDVFFYFILGPSCLLFVLYFMVIEIGQLLHNSKEYLKSVWNYVDMLSLILIVVIVLQGFFRVQYAFQHSLHAFASLFMWFKFLYFLRIFKSTGYFIRMLLEVVKDMKIFLTILIIVLCAFADAFLSLSNGNKDESLRFAGSSFPEALLYSYRLALGDFQVDLYNESVQSIIAWILFVFSSILVLVVMLNLLIAIISESFARINSLSIQANYQERARIISENSYLIPRNRQMAFANKDQYILVARDKNQEIEAEKEIKDKLENLEKKVNEMQEIFEDKFNKILSAIKN